MSSPKFKIYLFTSLIFLIVSVYLVVAPIVDNPKIEYIYSIIFMLGGALIYVPFVMYRLKMPFLSKITQCLQLIMKAIPPSGMPDCWKMNYVLFLNQFLKEALPSRKCTDDDRLKKCHSPSAKSLNILCRDYEEPYLLIVKMPDYW